MSNVLTSAAVSVSISPVPLSFLPIRTPVPTCCILAKVIASSSILADANVPDAILSAFKAVKFAPLAAGNVAGNLPFGISPDPRLSAFNDVSDAPEPLNVVAVAIPDTIAPD